MITGITTALLAGDFLPKIIFDMQAIASEPIEVIAGQKKIELPQVHALNCLKDIFTNTQLGPSTEPYVANTLEITASCIESNT